MATAKKKPGPAPKVAKPPKSIAIVRTKAANQEKNFAKLRAKAAAIGNSTGSSSKAIALKKDDRHLTEMQMMFVRHWAAGESIISASARAGYSDSGSMAYRLVKDPAVIKIYEREKKLYEASCQMTRARVMEGFLDAAAMAKLQADPTALVGAWREVGKMCGYYEPVKKIIEFNVNGTITQKVERLDTETLLKIINGEIAPDALGDVLDVDFKEVEEEDA